MANANPEVDYLNDPLLALPIEKERAPRTPILDQAVEVLERINAFHDAEGREPGRARGFKCVYEVEGRRPNLDSVRSVVADHVAETRPLSPAKPSSARPLGPAGIRSIRTASLEWGCHPKRLREILRTADIGPETDREVDNNVTFGAEEARAVLDGAADYSTM